MKRDYKKYYENVKRNVEELKGHYPFVEMKIYPTDKPSEVELNIIAVNKKILEITGADKEMFTGAYSRELKVIIPFDYQNVGCEVYGAKWVRNESVNTKDWHFFPNTLGEYKRLCVGVPKSFSSFENVILECVKTAENMLIAYEQIHKGVTNKLEIKAYSHGEKGKDEYERDKRKYREKR